MSFNPINSTVFTVPSTDSPTVVFLDPSISDAEILLKGTLSGVETIILSSQRDSVEQITEVLKQNQNIETVHIVCHGAPGCLYLGNGQLSIDNLKDYASQLQECSRENLNLLLYGCNVGAGDAGEEFLDKLHSLTGAKIAASATKTGNAALGGNWNLEVIVGEIISPLAFSDQAIANYAGILAPTVSFNVSSIFDSDVIVNRSTGVTDTTQTAIDLTNNDLITQSFATFANSTTGNGLPDNGFFGATSFNPDIQLSYRNSDNGNNARLIKASTGSFTFSVSGQYAYVHLALTSTEGTSNISLTFNYSDGTTETTNSQTIPDWYNEIAPSNTLYYLSNGLDRSKTDGTGFEDANNPAVFGVRFSANAAKTLQSITVQKTTSTGYLVFFGATGELNTAPALTGTAATLSNGTEDTAYTISATNLLQGFTDVDGDTLSVSGLTASNGTVINNGNGTYTFNPNANYNGTVSLSYNVIDGKGGTTPATRTFSLAAVNDAPTLTGTAATLSNGTEDTAYTISATNLLQGFTDVDGDTLSVSGLTASNGTVINNGNGTYTFNPNANYNGTVSLSYNVIDGKGGTTPATRTFSLAAVNDAPTLTGTAATLSNGTEDTAYTISATNLLQGFTDVDGDTLSVSGLTASNGTVINNGNGTYTFNPNANYNGTVSLSYNVIDGKGGTTPATRTFSLAAVNDAPTLTGTAATLSNGTEDTAYTISATNLLQGFTDVDGDTLSVSGLTASNGTVINNGNGTYTFNPNANYNGTVSLSYNVIDGKGGTTPATNTFSLAAVNDAPTLTGTAATLSNGTEDTAYTISATNLLQGFTDVDGDTLSVSGLTASNGTVINNGNGTYTFNPNANYNGTVSLSYNVTDGSRVTTPATNTFSLAAVNDAPTLTGTAATLSNGTEDTAYTISATNLLQGFTDVDGDTLSVSGLTATNGTVINNGNGTYTFNPNANYNGLATLNYNVIDGKGGTTPATSTFSLAAVNDAPALTGTAATLSNGTEDTAYTINQSDLLQGFTDVDGDSPSIANLTASNGTVINNGNGTYTFNPNANYNGLVTLNYNVTDGNGGSTTATGTFNLTAVNQAPTLTGTAATLTNGTEDTAYTISATSLLQGFTDVEADSLSIANLTANNGTVINNGNGTYTFNPNANYNGTVNLNYNVTDGNGAATAATSTFSLAAVNDAPTLTETPTNLSNARKDTPYTISAISLLQGFTDVDGDSLSIANLTASNGSLTDNANGTYTFNPNANYNGLVTLNYNVTDGNGGATAATNTFNVTEVQVNEAPVLGAAASGSLAYKENAVATKISSTGLKITDVDNPNVTSATISITGNYQNGEDILSVLGTLPTGIIVGAFDTTTGTITLTGSATRANYTTALARIAYSNTSDNPNILARTVSFTVNDGTTNSNTVTRTINVTAVNDAPILTGTAPILSNGTEDTVYTISATSLLQGFTDVDGDTLSVSNLTASNGTVADNGNGTYTFNPNTNYNGLVTLKYNVIDGNSGSTAATSTFSLAAVNDAPTLTGKPAILSNGTEDTAYTISATNLLQGFTDVDGDTLSVSGLTANNGTVTNNGNGTYTFKPNANYNGTVSLNYNISDGKGGSTAATRTFSLAAVNDAPTLTGTTATLSNGTEDTAYTISAINLLQGFTDVDGDTLSVSGLTANNGTVVNNGNGTYTFNPNANYNGTVSLNYNISDGKGGSTAATRTFSLAAVNDAPTLTGTTATLSNGTEDTAYTISATNLLQGFTDVDGDTLSVSGLTANNGTVTNNGNGTYTFNPNANYNGTVSLNYNITDGKGGSTAATRTFSLAAVNDAPTLTGTAVTLSNGTENTAYTISATKLLQGFTDIEGDILSVSKLSASNGTVADNGNGIYTFKPNANYNGFVTLSYNVIDGKGGSTATGGIFSLAAVNDAPVLGAAASDSLAYIENAAATKISSTGLKITDVDNSDISSATISITGNYQKGQDILSVIGTLPTGITANAFDTATGTITLTGSATFANYTTALTQITYSNTSENPNILPRTVSFTVNDGTTNSNAVTCTINVTAVNDAPVLSAAASDSLAYTENAAATLISPAGLGITDVDNTNITSATISITDKYQKGEDILSVLGKLPTGITAGVFNATTGKITLTGSASFANYTTALAQIAYSNTSESPNTDARTVSFTVNDGRTNSNAVIRTINVTAVNNAPVLGAAALGSLLYMKKKESTLISSTGLGITDVDNPNIISATISITGNYQTDEDILSVLGTLPPGITADVFDPATGTITLTGSATLADYKIALAQIAYKNTSDNPNISTRTVSFTVNDGTDDSNTITRPINVGVVYTDLGLGTLLPPFVESFRKSLVQKVTANADSIEVRQAENNLVELTYLGDINISDLINKLGIGSTKTSFSLKNPSLTIEGTGQDRTYKVSIPKINLGDLLGIIKDLGKIDLPTDITKKFSSLGDVDLVLSNQGLSLKFAKEFNFDLGTLFSFNSAIPLMKGVVDTITTEIFGTSNITLSELNLNLFKNDENNLQLELNGLLNKNNVGFIFDKTKTIFDYKLKDKIDFGKWAADIPILNSFTIENPDFILSKSVSSLNNPKLGTLKLTKGFNFIGDLNFGNVNTDIGKFISSLGIGSIGADIAIDTAGSISFAGIIPKLTNIRLFGLGNFTAIFNNAALKLEVDNKLVPKFAIQGGITLKGYDPFQNNEPDLNFSGQLALDPKSLSASFQLDAKNGPWKNPFGLDGVEVTNLALQLGGSYIPPFIDNFGLAGNFKFGNFFLKGAFLENTFDPTKNAFQLTAEKPISLVDLLLGPVGSYGLSKAASKSTIITDALAIVNTILDVKVVSIDGPDEDNEIDPLIKFVPFDTTIADTTLTQGIAINGQLSAWGKAATLNIDANPFVTNPTLTGSLKLPGIDWGFMKLSGANDENLDLAFNVSSAAPRSSYLRGDGKLVIFGKTVAKVDVEITPDKVNIKDFDLDFGLVALDIDKLEVTIDKANLAKSKVTGSAKVKFFGKDIATATIDVNSDHFIATANLDFFGVLKIENAVFSINQKDNRIDIGGKATIFGRALTGKISIENNKLTVLGGISQDVGIGTIAADLTITTDGTPGGSNVKVGYHVGNLVKGDYSVSLAPLTSVENLLDEAIGKSAGKAVELVNDAINTAVKGFGVVSSTVLDIYSDVSKFASNLADSAYKALAGIATSIFGNSSNGRDDSYGNENNFITPGERNDKIHAGGGDDTILGGRGNDILYGEGNNDRIDGEWGDDFLSGGDGNDSLFGGDGKDRLNGDNGDDFLDGGSGDDYLDAWTGNDTLKGGDGNDFLTGGNDNDLLFGQGGKDVLHGDDGNDTLYGEDDGKQGKTYDGSYDDDILAGGNGNDYLYGGVGNDILYGEEGDDVLSGGDGKDYLHGYKGNDTLDGNNGDDVLFGQQGNDILYGGDGNDYLYGEDDGKQGQTYDGSHDNDILDGGAGNDYLYGGVGNDTLYGNTGNDILYGGDGNDYLNGYMGKDILDGGNGDDLLFGQQDNDILYGGDGNDTLYGEDDGKQNQTYDGSQDNDILNGGNGNDYLYGGVGNDVLYGQEGDDVLSGGDGKDYLNGYKGNDTLNGNNGDDVLFGQQGNDILYGGDGNDTLYGEDDGTQNQTYDGSQDNDILDGGAGNDFLFGGVGNDTLYGNTGNDSLSGGDGNDYLNGYKDSDTLDGGNGDDLLFGQQGNDILYGGDGNDSLYGEDDGKQNQTYDGSQDNDILDGGAGNDFLFGGVGNDTLYGNTGNDSLSGGDGNDYLNGYKDSDTLDGGNGDDLLFGQQGNDILYGGDGNDSLYGEDDGKQNQTYDGSQDNDILDGGAGNDFLFGGVGNDTLYGNTGNDSLSGGDGNDYLLGGLGNDVLVGGFGADKFIFNSRNEGTDRIQDFNRLEGDKILISALSFGTGVTLQQFNFNYSTNTLFFNNQQIAILDKVTNSNFSVNQDVTLV